MARLVLIAALIGGCYGPSPPAGSPCANGAVCPTGLICSAATMTCERTAIDAPDRDGTAADAADAAVPVDAYVSVDAAPGCFGTGHVVVCPSAPVTTPFMITTPTVIDTDTSPLCIAYGGPAPNTSCVVAGTDVTVASVLIATGSRPLVLLGTQSISLAGTIDVASHRAASRIGAGADPAVCVAGQTPSGTGGGPGGSLGGRGGNGGSATVDTLAAAPTVPSTLRGGCRGRDGASLGTVGMGGRGGGAIALIAGVSITITGTINASGEGGDSPPQTGTGGGGGGGGSGGMITLDATMITANNGARVFANGGGGGEGSSPASPGGSGSDPLAPLTPAPGGTGGSSGGVGGTGSAAAVLTGGNGTNTTYGGGGGGGAGVINVFPPMAIGGTVSPPPT